MSKKRAFVRYTKSGQIVPGSLILTNGSYPDKPALWKEVSVNECCSADSGYTPPYRVYTALLSQLFTADPTAIVLENTLDNTVTLSRNNTGDYSITGVDFTDVNKVYVSLKHINILLPSPANQFFWFSVASGVVNIRTTQVNFITNSFTPTDSILDKTPIEIRVYN